MLEAYQRSLEIEHQKKKLQNDPEKLKNEALKMREQTQKYILEQQQKPERNLAQPPQSPLNMVLQELAKNRQSTSKRRTFKEPVI